MSSSGIQCNDNLYVNVLSGFNTWLNDSIKYVHIYDLPNITNATVNGYQLQEDFYYNPSFLVPNSIHIFVINDSFLSDDTPGFTQYIVNSSSTSSTTSSYWSVLNNIDNIIPNRFFEEVVKSENKNLKALLQSLPNVKLIFARHSNECDDIIINQLAYLSNKANKITCVYTNDDYMMPQHGKPPVYLRALNKIKELKRNFSARMTTVADVPQTVNRIFDKIHGKNYNESTYSGYIVKLNNNNKGFCVNLRILDNMSGRTFLYDYYDSIIGYEIQYDNNVAKADAAFKKKYVNSFQQLIHNSELEKIIEDELARCIQQKQKLHHSFHDRFKQHIDTIHGELRRLASLRVVPGAAAATTLNTTTAAAAGTAPGAAPNNSSSKIPRTMSSVSSRTTYGTVPNVSSGPIPRASASSSSSNRKRNSRELEEGEELEDGEEIDDRMQDAGSYKQYIKYKLKYLQLKEDMANMSL